MRSWFSSIARVFLSFFFEPLMGRQGGEMAGFQYLGIGLTFMLEAAAFVVLGWWLDGLLGTAPWLLIVLTLVGVAAAAYTMIRMVEAVGQRAKTMSMSATAGADENRESLK